MKKVAAVMIMILAMVVFSFEQVGSDPTRDDQISPNCFAKCLIFKCKAKSNDLSSYAACVDNCRSNCHYTSCI